MSSEWRKSMLTHSESGCNHNVEFFTA
jgi:hypothetical protein